MLVLHEFVYKRLNNLVGYIHNKVYQGSNNRNRYKLNNYIYVWWQEDKIVRVFDTEQKKTLYILGDSEKQLVVINNILEIGNYNFYTDVSQMLENSLRATQDPKTIEVYLKIGDLERYLNSSVKTLFSMTQQGGELNRIELNDLGANDVVEMVETGILYFVFNGRNAWHSTWIQKYTVGCMHTNFQSAKDFVERKRVQGSVFYIKQLPCLIFKSKNKKIYITEINNKNPLCGYSYMDINNIKSEDKFNKKSYLLNGKLLKDILLSFDINSNFWNRQKPSKNSFFIFYSVNHDLYKTEDIPSELKIYNSVSYGKNNKLGWHYKKSLLDSSAIKRLHEIYKTSHVTDILY